MAMEWDVPSSTLIRGCNIRYVDHEAAQQVCGKLLAQLGLADLQPSVIAESISESAGSVLSMRLCAESALQWAPGWDTLGLTRTLHLVPLNEADLTREIVVAMLMSPIVVEFPSLAEFFSAVRIRLNIIRAARKTALAFHTREADRPTDCWRYDEDRGFVIRPRTSLIAALIKATQPDVSGQLFSFSCYRASEYLILLGIAQEIAQTNPALYQELELLWAEHPIKSGKFHDVFLREQGSMDTPLPHRYFVPGDRTWFRNPHEPSADASGFEGSWVIYMGGGEFSNFWKRDAPYTLTDKCLEIYHWRHALYLDEEGEPRVDESKVAALVKTSAQDSNEVCRIVAHMERYREPRGVYTDAGGCMDTTREFSRWVCPGTSDLVLPAR